MQYYRMWIHVGIVDLYLYRCLLALLVRWMVLVYFIMYSAHSQAHVIESRFVLVEFVFHNYRTSWVFLISRMNENEKTTI